MTETASTPRALASFPEGGLALVIGASGGIGGAVAEGLEASGRFADVLGRSRSTTPALDITREDSVAALAQEISERPEDLRLVFDCSGFLHGQGFMPEKSWSAIDPEHLLHAYKVNALGPALLMKHLLGLLPRKGKSLFATISAKVGSIADNHAGGWYAYRASKAAQNQLLRTAAIELGRKRPEAIALALHPGTVETGLTEPFGKQGLNVRQPAEAAHLLLQVIDAADTKANGSFLNYEGRALPW